MPSSNLHTPSLVPPFPALAVMAIAKAIFNWKGSKDSHLTIRKGDVISILQQGDKWWSGELNGQVMFDLAVALEL